MVLCQIQPINPNWLSRERGSTVSQPYTHAPESPDGDVVVLPPDVIAAIAAGDIDCSLGQHDPYGFSEIISASFDDECPALYEVAAYMRGDFVEALDPAYYGEQPGRRGHH